MSEEKTAEYWVGKFNLWKTLHPEIAVEHATATCDRCPHVLAPAGKCKKLEGRFFIDEGGKKGIIMHYHDGLAIRIGSESFSCLEWIKHV